MKTVNVLPSPATLSMASPAVMAADDVLDDGQAQPGAAALAAALHIHPIESLGQARQRLARDALAVILAPRPRHGRFRGPARHRHLPALAAIFDGVVDQVLEQLHQLVMVAQISGGTACAAAHVTVMSSCRRQRAQCGDRLAQHRLQIDPALSATNMLIHARCG